jgi:predicted MFS family arabinose efflux permease
VCLGFTTIAFTQFSLFGTLLPIIVKDFGIGYDLAGVLMGVWTIASIAFTPLFTRLMSSLSISTLGMVMILIQSASTLLTAYSYNLVALNAARLLMSFSMPLIWPVCAKLVSTYIPRERYGYATALYDIGSMIGLALTYVIASFVGSDWRLAMVLSSALGFLYTPAILAVLRSCKVGGELPRGGVVGGARGGDAKAFWRSYAKLGALLFLAFFFALYTWGFIVFWLSTFLVYELRLSYSYIALYMLASAAIASALEVVSGMYSDRVGGVDGKVRILILGLTPSALLLGVASAPISSVARLVVASLSIAFYRIAAPSFWSIVNELIPPEHVGRFSAVYTLAGPVSGIASSIVSGFVISLTGSATYAVLLAAISSLLSASLYTAVKRFSPKPC